MDELRMVIPCINYEEQKKIADMIGEVDQDGDGKIDYEEFLKMMDADKKPVT